MEDLLWRCMAGSLEEITVLHGFNGLLARCSRSVDHLQMLAKTSARNTEDIRIYICSLVEGVPPLSVILLLR
jgi:hypothetical protein